MFVHFALPYLFDFRGAASPAEPWDAAPESGEVIESEPPSLRWEQLPPRVARYGAAEATRVLYQLQPSARRNR